MCPIFPVNVIILYSGAVLSLWLAVFGIIGAAAQIQGSTSSPYKTTHAFDGTYYDITFDPEKVEQLKIGSHQKVKMKLKPGFIPSNYTRDGRAPIITELNYIAENESIASVFPQKISMDDVAILKDEDGIITATFNVSGNFLGYTKICTNAVDINNKTDQKCLDVSVIREHGVLDKAFSYSVAGLVTIMYVNMGAALDLTTIKETIKRPIGPAIGFFTQFMVMPLLSYGIAKLLIPVAALQLGLFVTGCSPGGGGSNVWTLAIGGNLDLSITMTTISTFAAFAMMPLWIFTLGSTIFTDANLTIPYQKIATFAIALVVPLSIGVMIQFKWPSVSKFLVRTLKPFSAFLLVFIIGFALYTNFYLFNLITWEIILAGLLLPTFGYIIGGGLSLPFKLKVEDVIAIAIETGVQNTGLSIFVLRFSLPQPEADLTTVVPVVVAMMTPLIPISVMVFQRIQKFRNRHSDKFSLAQKDDSSTPSLTPSV